MLPLPISGGAPGRSGVGISKAEIRLNPYAYFVPDLSFLYAAVGHHFAAPTDASRLRLASTIAANCTDFEQALAACKEVYAVKRNTSLKHVPTEEAFVQEIETLRRFHAAAAVGIRP